MTRLRQSLNPLRWRKMTLVMVVWVLLTLGAAAYGYWSIERSAVCFDAQGTGPFCRYRVFSDAVRAAAAPLLMYAVGTIVLGLVWLWTMPDRPACPKCGSFSRSDQGVCRRCGYDPFAPRSA
jgi:formate hydrogenlyase subunit 3/multisubunit Na+/H+ antiporter MnhD subunit